MEPFPFAAPFYRLALRIAIVVCTTFIAGCGHEGLAPMEVLPPERTFPVVPVTPSIAELAVRDTIRFHAVLKSPTASVVWTSSHPDVVEIDSITAFARAVGPGWATITAALRGENFRGGASVTVIPSP